MKNKLKMNEKIKLLRTALGLNQTEFAVKARISFSLLSKIETGDIRPSEKFLRSIIETWNVENWLLKDEGDLNINNEQSNINANTPWQDVTYKDLKETNSYLQKKYDEAMLMLSKMIDRGGSLGKYKASELAGYSSKQYRSGAAA